MWNAFIIALIGRRGRIISSAAGFCGGLIAWAVSRWGLDLTNEQQLWISTLMVGFIGWILDGMAAWKNAAGVAIVQQNLNEFGGSQIPVDGTAGPVTQAKAAAVATEAQNARP